LFSQTNRDPDSSPIFCRRPNNARFGNAIASEPNVDGMKTVRVRGDESLDLFLAQVLTVSLVERVAHLVEMPFQVVKSRMGKTDAEINDVFFGSGPMIDPTWRWNYNFLDSGLVRTYTGQTTRAGKRMQREDNAPPR
jgi:hypothetical protein